MNKLSIKTVVRFFSHFFVILILASFGYSAEIDDSSVFVEAFNAYQQKDYLLAVEKCDLLNQVFPDSPLKDVSLLLTARASLKSGDNIRAAKATSQFSKDFPESSLKTSVEDELRILAERLQKGEVLAADKNLQTVARKVRSDRIARERAAELKREAERIAKAKAEQERLAQIKREEEHREMERQLAEKRARASIKAEISIRDTVQPFSVGESGALPVEISNKGKGSDEFNVSVAAATDYNAILVRAGKTDEAITNLQLAAGEIFKGFIVFRMPTDVVDGHRTTATIKVVSAKFNDISFSKDTVLSSSAPLVRVVAKFSQQKVTPGEILPYRVTVLNVGSLAARNLTVRLQLPAEVEYVGTPDAGLKQESSSLFTYKIDRIDIGKLADLSMKIRVRDDSIAGQELRGRVEIFNEILQKKDIFSAQPSLVQAKGNP